MLPLTDPLLVVKEFWTRYSYNPAAHYYVRAIYFTEEEQADHPDEVQLLDQFLEMLNRDKFLTYSYEYSPDSPPIKMFQLTPMGIALGKQLSN